MMNMFRRQQQARTVRRPASSAQRPQPQLKSPREIQIMREAGRIVARVHAVLREAIRPGVSTWELDQLAAETMSKYNAASCFLGYRGFPAHICTSINEELVHGIPSKDRILKAGDIISIDVGVRYRGFIGDSAWTYAVGEISPEAQALMRVTEESLYQGIAQAHPGRRVVDISRAVQRHVEAHGFHVVREYTGHGVGRQMHEAPQVLNYESQDPDGQIVLQPGLVIAIEPMVQIGTWQTRTLKDNWTVISKDHSLTAHFEHTVAITNNGPEILTLP
ncbi:MAG: type I methionyl aminopeptidase [Caldilinea sp.]|jgi:methionyl aminopeptidase|uniref:type I methionyl aminopeptidase n=1 Tax=Caldilinea sp. TaxID=2293560 RepID=UPI0030AA21B6